MFSFLAVADDAGKQRKAFDGLDPTAFGIVVAGVAILIGSLFFFLRRHVTQKFDTVAGIPLDAAPPPADGPDANGAPPPGMGPGVRGGTRDGGARNRLAERLAARRAAQADARREEEGDDAGDDDALDGGAEGGAMLVGPNGRPLSDKERRAAERARRDAEREAQEQAREAAEEDALKKLREEKRQKDQAEYDTWVGSISVEEKGELGEQEQRRIEARRDAIEAAVTKAKMAVLENISKECDNIPIDELVKEIEHLVSVGRLSGVFDERGKFVVVSEQEFDAIAKFIKQRGRVSLVELTAECNRVITSGGGGGAATA